MDSSPYLIPNSIVTASALIGLLVVVRYILLTASKTPQRKLFCFTLINLSILMASRVLFWNTDLSLFNFTALVSASLIPITAIMLIEGLLRRHAPKCIKIFILFGTGIFIISTMFQQISSTQSYFIGLLCFQVIGFLIVAWLIYSRKRDTLSFAENGAIERLALSLIFILPFIITDFNFTGFLWPVKMSGLAILMLCWLSLNLARTHLDKKLLLLAFFYIVFFGIGAGLIISLQTNMDTTQAVQTISIILSFFILTAVLRDYLTLRAESQYKSLLEYLSKAPLQSFDEFMVGLESNVLTQECLILRADDLQEYDLRALNNALMQKPFYCIDDLNTSVEDDNIEDSQIRSLFEANQATHIVLASDKPFVIIALNQPNLTSEYVDKELKTTFNLARIIAERDHLKEETVK